MLLQIKDLEVRYGGICAVNQVSLQVEKGSVLAILGANGAGKSSLLDSIMGVSQGKVRGSILFNGKEILGQHADAIVRRGVSMSPEGRQLFSGLTVDENVRMGGFLRRDLDQLQRAREDILTLFPRLRERLKQLAGTLSGGEQQMVAVGVALMSAPDLFLMDEPTLGLAPIFIDEIMELISKIRDRGITVIVVEQNASKALARADYAHVMEKGRIVLSGNAREMAQRDDIASAYLGTK